MLPQLKHDGHVVSAQPTMTNCTIITIEKLLRSHINFDLAMNEARALNGNLEELEVVEDHFISILINPIPCHVTGCLK